MRVNGLTTLPKIHEWARLLPVLLAAALAAPILVAPAPALAGEIRSYKAEEFEKAQKEGKRILLQFHASWCPVCKKQKNSLDALVKDAAYDQVLFVSADYDEEDALKKKYKPKGQSTIILFKGEKELEKAFGVTDKDKIKELVTKLAGA